MATKTAGNLLPGRVNTPLDARFAFDTLADAEQMQNPVLGGIFYCRADGKHYKITELESKLVGAITVANAKVKSYEEFGGNPEEIAAINTSLAGLQSTVNKHEGLITDNKNAAANLRTQYNGLDTRVSALEISGGGTTVTAQQFASAPNNKVQFAGNIPVGVMTNSGKYYPVEKGSLTIAGSVATLDVTPYLAYDNAASFSGIWTAYFATGTAPASVLDWIAPDPAHVTDIPAWNTVYQAANACWIAVSIVGCAGAVLLGTEAQYVDSHPMGFYVGGGTDSVYSFVFCPKGWFYKAFLSSTTATLSYSHKQIWKCKGA